MLAQRAAWPAVLLAASLAAAASDGTPPPDPPDPPSFSGRVVGVMDGDTIAVMRDGRAVTVRIEGIDCPERHQDFSDRAKRFTSDLVFEREVMVVSKSYDRYGRVVAQVLVDGSDLSLEIVRAGLAWHFTRYSSDPRLAAAERDARALRKGLWAHEKPVPPWEYRAASASTRTPR